jgi:hypothetical protein
MIRPAGASEDERKKPCMAIDSLEITMAKLHRISTKIE